MLPRTKPSHMPMRLTTGGYILNAGVDLLDAGAQGAEEIHSTAAEAFPVLDSVDPRTFTTALAASEIALGSALVTPLVPSRYAGAGLAMFAAGLLAVYVRTPRMHRPQSIRPTHEGRSLAKDAWMMGIALTLLADRGSRRRRRSRRD
jgi:hypothetical protein